MEDFNNAERSFDVIPDNTIAMVQLTIHPGGVGEGNWLKGATTSKGTSEGLDCEFVVVDGAHAKRRFWQRLTLDGSTDNHREMGKDNRVVIREMLESAYGFKPNDKSDAAKTVRKISSWGDLNQLRFVVRIGVQPPSDGYNKAKNTLKEVITPERQDWRKPEQIDRSQLATPAATPASSPAPAPTPAATAIVRPVWAK
jgi:hypothetical protein